MPHLYYLEERRWMRIYYLEPPTLGMVYMQVQLLVLCAASCQLVDIHL